MIDAIHATDAMEDAIERWVADTGTVLDTLARRAAPGSGDARWAGRIDVARAGILGMSFGGATATGTCIVDARCVVGMNLDGLHYGEGHRRPVPIPFVFATSGPNRFMHDLAFLSTKGRAIAVTVGPVKHNDWTALPLISPLFALLGVTGKLDARRMQRFMDGMLVGVLGEYLQGQPAWTPNDAGLADVTWRGRHGSLGQ